MKLKPGYLDRSAQEALAAAVAEIIAQAPLYAPRMPGSGSPFSVRMTNCGPLGWVSDQRGYRYQPLHPVTDASAPEACLINVYAPTARMGLHQDRDEHDFAAPVVSLSLGETCLFRLGGTGRRDPTRSFRLASGDALVLGGHSRLAFHGVDRIIPGTSTLLPDGSRI